MSKLKPLYRAIGAVTLTASLATPIAGFATHNGAFFNDVDSILYLPEVDAGELGLFNASLQLISTDPITLALHELTAAEAFSTTATYQLDGTVSINSVVVGNKTYQAKLKTLDSGDFEVTSLTEIIDTPPDDTLLESAPANATIVSQRLNIPDLLSLNPHGWEMSKHPRMLADANGDGKDDLIGFGNAGVGVAVSSGGGFGPANQWVAAFGYDAGGWRVNQHLRTMADVNGDGKADVVGFGNGGVGVGISTGSSFTPQTWVNDFGYDQGWRLDQHERVMADVNGDGKDDVVGFGNGGVLVATSTGSRFSTPS